MQKVTRYIADDGTEFDNEAHCIEHEKVMRNINRIIDLYYSSDMLRDDWRKALYELVSEGAITINPDKLL